MRFTKVSSFERRGWFSLKFYQEGREIEQNNRIEAKFWLDMAKGVRLLGGALYSAFLQRR